MADPHIGPRGTLSAGLWRAEVLEQRILHTFQELLIWAQSNQVHTIVVAGDMFDRTWISPKLIRLINESLKIAMNHGVHVWFLQGNHEVNAHDGCALDYISPTYCELVKTGGIRPLTSVDGLPGILWVPYEQDKTAKELIETNLEVARMEGLRFRPEVLIGHFGVYEHDQAEGWEKNDPLAVDVDWLFDQLETTPIRFVLVGHYHRYKVWRRDHMSVVRIGSLSPRGWNEQGLDYGNVVVVGESMETNRLTYDVFHGEVAGVRFLKDRAAFKKDELTNPEADKRCWFILKEKIDPFPIKNMRVVQEYETIYDVIGGAVTVAAYHDKKKLYGTIPSRDDKAVDAKGAVQKYVKTKGGQLTGPRAGLLSEAVGRMDGYKDYATNIQPPDKPWWMRGL